jgi:hypothetical protein
LDFQIAQVWAPEQNNLQRKEPVCSSLQFSLMGPKLYISPEQVFFLVLISPLKIIAWEKFDRLISSHIPFI